VVDRDHAELSAARHEVEIVLAKAKHYRRMKVAKTSQDGAGRRSHSATLHQRDLSTVMSPRTVITWAENAEIFGDLGFAFRVTFLNNATSWNVRSWPSFYQRCFGASCGIIRQRGTELKIV